MFTFEAPKKNEQDRNNRKKIELLVKNHFDLGKSSQEYFSRELWEPTLPDEIANLLEKNGDLRISKEIDSDEHFEREDEGWRSFRGIFKNFIYGYKFFYRDFRNGKVLIQKNYVKTRKAIVKFYTDSNNWNYLDYDLGIYFKSYEIIEEYSKKQKEKIIERIDKHLNKIGTMAIPKKKKLKVTITVNFADWFLCSTKENWCSCLSLTSNYTYWTGLPGLIGDKNRVMIYVSNGREKNFNGIETEGFISRTWGILTDFGNIVLIQWYPHQMVNAELINEAFETDIFISEEDNEGWTSKYPINSIYDSNEDSRFIYQDYSSFEFIGEDLFIIDNGDSTYSFHNKHNKELIHEDLYRLDVNLNDLIAENSTVLNENKNNSRFCEECGASINYEEQSEFNGVALCSCCYEYLVVYTYDAGEMWKEDCTYVESMGKWYSNQYIRDNFVISVYDKEYYEKEDCCKFINRVGDVKYILKEDLEENKDYMELHDGTWTFADYAIFDKEDKVYYSRLEWNKLHKNQL